jgi:hypothetical protein
MVFGQGDLSGSVRSVVSSIPSMQSNRFDILQNWEGMYLMVIYNDDGRQDTHMFARWSWPPGFTYTRLAISRLISC